VQDAGGGPDDVFRPTPGSRGIRPRLEEDDRFHRTVGTRAPEPHEAEMKILTVLNALILRRIRILEMTGVVLRIMSVSLVSWLGPASPFLFVWIFNTLDAILLSWCSLLKKDRAYSVLNLFWIGVGVVGILRATAVIHP
jgi:hypothetical protein